MRINPASLLRVAPIDCRYFDDETEEMRSARLAFITEDTVNAAQAAPIAMAEGREAPEVQYGGIVAVCQNAEGGRTGNIYGPGDHGHFLLELPDGASIPFTGASMLNARQVLAHLAASGTDIGDSGRNALQGIQACFQMICANPDPERYPATMIANAFISAATDFAGDVEMAISPEEFARKMRADSLRAQIGLLSPDHADALTNCRPLNDVLSRFGASAHVSIGAASRAGVAGNMQGQSTQAVARANDHMVRRVFGAMTRTPAERLAVTMIPLTVIQRVSQDLAEHKITGDWIGGVQQRLDQIFGEMMPGYRASVEIASVDGNDILLVTDSIGNQNGMGYIYSWPSADRVLLMDIGANQVFTISPEEVPSEEEIIRLQGVVDEIAMMNDHDDVFDHDEDYLDPAANLRVLRPE